MPREYRVPSCVTTVQRIDPMNDVRRVVVHSAVSSIAADAFRNWRNLAEIVFAGRSALEQIGDHAFAGTSLWKFVAPASLRRIGAGAFMDCRCLKEVKLNEGLEQLGGEGDGVFQDSVVETVYIPSTLQ